MSKVRTRWSRFSFFLTYIILPDSNSDSEAEVTPHQESPTYPQSVTYEKTPSETDNDMSYSVSSELEKYSNVFNVNQEKEKNEEWIKENVKTFINVSSDTGGFSNVNEAGLQIPGGWGDTSPNIWPPSPPNNFDFCPLPSIP